MGVILYILISGTPPFSGPNNQAIMDAVSAGNYTFEGMIEWQTLDDIWKSVSKECMELIRHMLTPAEQRLTAEQVLKHPWMAAAGGTSAVPFPLQARKNLQRFGTLQKLKKAVLSYLATQLSEKEVTTLKSSFVSLDKNGDGILSCEEVLSGFKGSPAEGELQRIVGLLDTDKSGFIDYNGEASDHSCRVHCGDHWRGRVPQSRDAQASLQRL